MNLSRNLRCCRADHAFSLIELLVVVALILVLTTLYWGTTSTSRAKKTLAACQENLEKMYIALQIYSNDHQGKFPASATARTSDEPLNILVPRYTADTTLFICPGSKDSALPDGEPITGRRISYAYYMGRTSDAGRQPLMSDRQVDTSFKTSGQAVFSTSGKAPGNNHEKSGGIFLFCDGTAEATPALAPFSMTASPNIVLLNPKP